jgi:hypothetical protein
MDPLTLVLAVVAALSEILPLVGITDANGVLHGLHCTLLHLSADSQCHVEVDVARSPAQSPQRDQPPLSQSDSTIALASTTGTTAAAPAGATTAGAGTTTAAPGASDGPASMTNFAAGPP